MASTDLTFEQKYLLEVCKNARAPEKYFTRLGLSLIDSCFSIHPREHSWNTNKKGGKRPSG